MQEGLTEASLKSLKSYDDRRKTSDGAAPVNWIAAVLSAPFALFCPNIFT
jgi:hypothetical protein